MMLKAKSPNSSRNHWVKDTERLNQQIWLPLLAGLDPKSASALALLFVGVLAALNLMKTVVPIDTAKSSEANVDTQ